MMKVITYIDGTKIIDDLPANQDRLPLLTLYNDKVIAYLHDKSVVIIHTYYESGND